MGKRFASQFSDRGVVKVTDKLLIHNIDTGVTEYSTVDKLLDALGIKGQVKFPPVQVPSSNVNTLDDYEEGMWTPVYEGTTGTIGATAYTSTGRYTKIGRLVFIAGSIVLTNNGDWTGVAKIKGLPFNPALDTIGNCGVSNITFDGQIHLFINASTNFAYLRLSKTGIPGAYITCANVPDNGVFYFSALYSV
jgi:hypothetical protein